MGVPRRTPAQPRKDMDMNRSTPARIVAALASTCITFALFAGVASLGDAPHEQASTPIASLPITAAHEVRS